MEECVSIQNACKHTDIILLPKHFYFISYYFQVCMKAKIGVVFQMDIIITMVWRKQMVSPILTAMSKFSLTVA